MPTFTAGYDLFKKVLGSGIKNSLFTIKIPDMALRIKDIIVNQQDYLTSNPKNTNINLNTLGSTATSYKNISDVINNIEKAFTSLRSILDSGGTFLSLCKTATYPSESYDVITNSYWTRRVPGKINLTPLSFSFYMDPKYNIYDIFNYFNDAKLLDKEHGIYNYPDAYTFKKITVATFNPAIFNINTLINPQFYAYNTAIYVKNYYNCWISSIGEISKDKSAKDTLEEFSLSLEYEKSNTGDIDDIAEVNITKALYNAKDRINAL